MIAFQHPCRKTLDPRCFSHVTKIREFFEFFSIWCWIHLIVSQKNSKCLNGRVKSRADMLLKKIWPNGRKCFAQIENFLNKMQKSYIQCTERKKIFSRQNLSKKFSGHAKSRWEIIIAKVFAKKYYIFLWKSEKTTKRLMVFRIFAFFQTDPLDSENILPQFYPRLLEVGLVIHASFFFNKKTKRCRSRSEKIKKVLNFFRKRLFRRKCPMKMQIRQLADCFLLRT